MPNRYIPSALVELVQERHEVMLDDHGKDGGGSTDEYISEYEALVSMLQPEYREEFWDRHDG